MTTIYRANNARLSVADAKRLISDAAPRGEAVDIYASIDERGNIDFDGPIETRLDPNANITGTFIDADFPALCERLGIVPTNKFRPARTDYPNMPEIDELWTISHDEFVRLAESHGLNVVTGDASGDAVTEKKTYPRGSGFSGATSRPEPEPPARPMADWELWAHMPKATVREAVLLSLGLEPRPPVLTWTQYEAPRSYAEPGREFERRLMLAAAHVDASGPLRPLVSMPFPEDATVSLAEFGAWARGLGWVLPEGYPRLQAPAEVPEPPPVASASGADTEQQPDPQRRLAILRARGGSATYKRGEWKFTGIAALVASEKAEGRKRRDEKTIRADLREAAQAERDEKQAGPWQGLGG